MSKHKCKWEAGESADGEMLVFETGSDEAIAAVFPLSEMRTNPYADLITLAPELLLVLRLAVARQGFSDDELISARKLLKELEKIY